MTPTEQAIEALELCERSVVLIGNSCNEKHVSEAVMDRALEAQVQCIDAARAALAALRGQADDAKIRSG